ncbi:hypothetical protein TRV_02157 [Trichophyton verrucosum HKI 0517]|uniref:Uncharacterized protein n=1 Tax=Trichophyton verrucosum (strain HKI 0517) TaxID=663202 RepID=D4D4Y9_TRIVH|nr:uncharacterized protein TRV_02157 [Trichophyton verrucosum HKI 0517]EFE43087.1 hypothetical protein TRV_02157 [Trichophyton verrucosum HKI 0517]
MVEKKKKKKTAKAKAKKRRRCCCVAEDPKLAVHSFILDPCFFCPRRFNNKLARPLPQTWSP